MTERKQISILKDQSKIMNPTPSFFSNAIVIGAGSIMWETRILDIISRSQFKGLIVVTDRMIYHCLLHGITPQKFNMVACCQEFIGPEIRDESMPIMRGFFESELIKKYCKGMEIIVTCVIDPELYQFLESKGFVIRTVHRFGKVCVLKDVEKIDIKTGGNVGMFGHQVARVLFGIRKIGTVGLEFDFSKHDTVRKDRFESKWEPELSISKGIIAEEFIKDGLVTYNLNGRDKRGKFYGKGIKSMDIDEFL